MSLRVLLLAFVFVLSSTITINVRAETKANNSKTQPKPPAKPAAKPVAKSSAKTSAKPALTPKPKVDPYGETTAMIVEDTSDAPLSEEEQAILEVLQGLGEVRKNVKRTGVDSTCLPCELAKEAQQNKSAPMTPASATTGMKTLEEVDAYISCYMDDSKIPESDRSAMRAQREAYFKEYRPLIKTAAAEFGIPEAFFACLVYRESVFDKNAKSKTGALGLGQFTEGTREFLTVVIDKMDAPVDKIAKFEAIAANADETHTKKDVVYAQRYLFTYYHSQKWKSYFEKLKAGDKFSGPTPQKFGPKGAQDPALAIGASALYLRYMVDLFHKGLNAQGNVNTDTVNSPDEDFLMVVAGAYNQGPGDALETLGPIRPASARAWRERLMVNTKDNKERRDHMISVRNCVKKGSTAAMVGTEDRQCQ